MRSNQQTSAKRNDAHGGPFGHRIAATTWYSGGDGRRCPGMMLEMTRGKGRKRIRRSGSPRTCWKSSGESLGQRWPRIDGGVVADAEEGDRSGRGGCGFPARSSQRRRQRQGWRSCWTPGGQSRGWQWLRRVSEGADMRRTRRVDALELRARATQRGGERRSLALSRASAGSDLYHLEESL